MFDRQEQVCLLSLLSFILYSSVLCLVAEIAYIGQQVQQKQKVHLFCKFGVFSEVSKETATSN
jgi:hypothetical protein